MRLALGVFLCTLAAASGAIGSADTARGAPTRGEAVEHVLEVAGKQVPLPAGRWVVAGAGYGRVEPQGLGAFGVIHNLVLFRIAGTTVEAALEVNVNALHVTEGWGIARACRRGDIAFALVRYEAGWDGACLFVTHTLGSAADLPPAWAEALALAIETDLALPTEWLTAGVRVANRRDVIDARFHFAPAMWALAGEPVLRWANSAWSAQRLEADPVRLAWAGAVARWAVAYSGRLDLGLKHRLDGGRPLPMPTVGGTEESVVQARIEAIEALARSGQLGVDAAARQTRWLAERGERAGSQTLQPGTVALVKALTYQPAALVADYGLALAGIGEAAAGPLGLAAGVGATTLFYLNERLWERFTPGPRRDSARTVDFGYFGTDR